VIVEPVVLVILAAASYRLTHVLVGTDSLLEQAHQKLSGVTFETDHCDEILSDECDRPIPKPNVSGLQLKLTELVVCPFCLGYWVGLVMLCLWAAEWPWELGWKGWLSSLAIAGGQSFFTAIDGRS